MSRTLILLACSATLAACGGSDDGFPIAAECNPLGTNHCMLPWPSAVFETEDASTRTGMRLAIGETTLFANVDDEHVDPAPYNRRDGFSAAAPMVIAFDAGIDAANLVSHDRYADSLTDDSPTVILDMETGERVAHFAELDVTAADTPGRQALLLRPAQRLQGNHRYAVAIRSSLKARDGSALPISAGFQAILDGSVTDHPLLEKVRPRYEAIFATIEAAGIPRDDLILAWDFTTASDESMWEDVLSARAQAIDTMGEAGANLSFAIDSDNPHDDERIARRLSGTFEAPLFLTQGGVYRPGTVMVRDESTNLPVLQGTYDAPFRAIIPECALTAEAPVGIMLYGHGLFGDSGEVAAGDNRDTVAELCVVSIATDWRGMSALDVGNVARALNNLNNSSEIFDVLIQGIINQIALEHIVRGPMAEQLFVDQDGNSYVDPTKVFYYGLSQGHIFGSTFMAYDPFITRGVVGVGGANYSMMLERSTNWPTYRQILTGAHPDPLDVALALSLMQIRWDLTDPVSTSHAMVNGGLPDTPEKQLILHMARFDEQVPNIATEYQARTMGIPVLAPTTYQPWGMQAADGPITGSALVVFDDDLPPAPLTNTPPQDFGAHYLTREQPATRRQMKHFYETGEIINECGSEGCYCAAGACE